MSDHTRKISTAIQKLSGNFKTDRVKYIWCTVLRYDQDVQTCDVTGENDVEIDGVSLSAGIADGHIKYPTAGSTVVIAETINSPFRWVVLWSDIDFIQITSLGGNGGTNFNDGRYGGLVVAQDSKGGVAGLLAKINQLEEKLTGLANYVGSLPIPVSGSVSAAPIPANTEDFQINDETVLDDIINPTVTHGE